MHERPRPTKLRTGADALRDAKRIRGTKAAKQPSISPTLVLREMRDGVPTEELENIRQRLDLICSCVIVVHHALEQLQELVRTQQTHTTVRPPSR